MNPEKIPSTYIEDVDLAHDMANAEHDFRDYGLVAKSVALLAVRETAELGKNAREALLSGSYIGYQFLVKAQAERNSKLATTQSRARSDVKYFKNRANYASDALLARHEGRDIPEHDSPDLEAADNERRYNLLKSVLLFPELMQAMGVDEVAVTEKRQEIAEELKPFRKAQADAARQNRNASLLESRYSLNTERNPLLRKMLDVPGFSEQTVSEHNVRLFDSMDSLEPMKLFEGATRKDAVRLKVFEFITKAAWQQLAVSASEDLNSSTITLATRYWKNERVMKVADSLVNNFHGTVTELSVMKMPQDEAWEKSYFGDAIDTIYPKSVQRLRFMAALKSTGRAVCYSALDSVIYVRRDEDNGAVIPTLMVPPRRRTDQFIAEAVQRSIEEESRGIAEVVESNRSTEILGGLPGGGKQSRHR